MPGYFLGKEGTCLMINLPMILATLFVLYIGIVRPLLRRRSYQKFRREVVTNPALRSQYYLRMLVEPWLWLVVIYIILRITSAPLSVIGLGTPHDWGLTLWLIVEILVLTLIVVAIIRYRIAKTHRPGLATLLLKVKDLLPHTAYERRLWILVSITAGIWEEVVFRGFLITYFLAFGTFFGLLAAVILSSILFGFAHIYQGWKGVLVTGVLGAILASVYVSTGSLIVPIVCHILIDARIVFLAPALLKLDQEART
jgi:membrane protease YdiL (CAAX protease family)